MLKLRPATPEDAEAMATIYTEQWNEGFGHLLGIRQLSESRIDRWRLDIADPETSWTVAELDGEVVGFVGVRPSREPPDPDLGELFEIHVDPHSWRAGVGRALMDEAVEQLAARWSRAILWTPARYERGHDFYEAMGWQPLGTTRKMRTEVAFGRDLH